MAQKLAIGDLTPDTAPTSTDLVELDGGRYTSIANFTKGLTVANGTLIGVLSVALYNLLQSALQDVVDDTTPTLGGNLDANDKEIQDAVMHRMVQKVYSETWSAAGTYTPDASDGNYHFLTIEDDFTLGVPGATGVPAVSNTVFQMVIDISIDATGGYTMDISNSFTFLGKEPVISNDANDRTIIIIQTRDQGSTWEVVGDADLSDLPAVAAAVDDLILLSDTSDSDLPKVATVESINAAPRTITSDATAGTAQTPDMAVASRYYYNLDNDLTINAASNRASAGEEVIVFEIEADGTSEVTWNAAYSFGDQSDPDFSALSDGDRYLIIGRARDGGTFDMVNVGPVF